VTQSQRNAIRAALVRAIHNGRDIIFFGCGLKRIVATAPREANFDIWFNVTTPYMPITSDGKEPDLCPFLDGIRAAVGKAVKGAHRPGNTGRASQKDVVLDNLDDAIAKVSGDGRYRFGERQLLYRIRKIVGDELGKQLTTANFKAIITDYEAEHGEIPGMYREPRGSIYHPHRGETIALGTLMVENYERPLWTYNKLVYIEKEGFSEALKAERWAERHDCALLSSKGFTTRAARDFVDKLAEHDEPVTIFCVHDADAFGTMIFQTFQEATKARGARKIKIINLGLEPWEAIAMGLDVEDLEREKRSKAVADYVKERDDGTHWEDWLQEHRVELNAMTTPEFIEWLDGKMTTYEKLVPPADVLTAEFNRIIESKLRDAIVERILREANVDEQVATAVAAIEEPDVTALVAGIEEMFERTPDTEWRDHIEEAADLKIETF
jgi:Topoisomerase 6 subunit A/Spo11, Toprim domain